MYEQILGEGENSVVNSNAKGRTTSGASEQTLSRDIYRLGHRMSFFRLLSVFYTTIGFYFNTMLAALTVYKDVSIIF